MTIIPEPVLATAGAAAPAVAPDGARRLGRRMILLSALSQNVASGLMFGSFGTLIVDIEQKMHVDRGLSTAGASLVILAIGLIAPFVGTLIRRLSIRTVLIMGAILCGSGYATASVTTDIVGLLAAYGLLVGPGIALLGIAVPTALVANWFVLGRGRAIGIVNMPIFVALVPPIMAMLLPVLGLSGAYLVLSVICFALVPALLLVIDRPEQVGMRPHGHLPEHDIDTGVAPLGTGALLRTADYWFIGLAAAIMAGGGATIATHIMPFAMGQGVAPEFAAVLISVLGASGILGSVVYGMLADRLGGGRALMINSLIQAVLWAGLLMPMNYVPRLVLTALIGINAGGMLSTLGTALSQRFGAAALGGALGLWSLINLPFAVGMPPLAGVLFARMGGYEIAFAVQIGLFVAAALLAAIAAHRARLSRA